MSSAWLAGWWMSGHGMRLEVVPALSMLALRHFKHARDPEAREPKNPAVKFLINAWDTGDLSEAETFIAPDCAVKMNGLAFEPDATNDSVSALRQSIETWRGLFPDLDMTLLEEVGKKDQIAVEGLISGTHTGSQPDLPATGNAVELRCAVFLMLSETKIVEMATVYDGLSLAIATGATDAPSWWPVNPQPSAHRR